MRSKFLAVFVTLTMLCILGLGQENTASDWFYKGNALADQGKYDEALQAYEEAIRLDPEYANAWNKKGIALADQGNYDEAIDAYEEAIGLNPELADAWYNKGVTLQLLGRNSDAEAAFAQAGALGA